jgi:ABC-type multidrug transport system permease subunit
MIALGLLVAARISSEELAGGILNLLSWPMMALSGVFFSIDGAPAPLRWFAELLPLTQLVAAWRAIMLDGAGFTQVLHPLSMLAAMSGIFVTAGAGLFKWRQY